ncbi:MAG: GNAT family N-acetyltransferase [Acidimicrobiales bacterium]
MPAAGTGRKHKMDVSVNCPQDLSQADLSAWRRLQASDPALDNAFLSPEFVVALGRCRSNVRIAVIRDGAETVAFLPFQKGPFGIGWAVGIGASDAQAVICEPEFAFNPIELIRACKLGMWEFDHLVSRMNEFEPCISGTAPAFVMDVREGYDKYMRQRNRGGGRLVRSLAQKRRRLIREHGELEFVFDSTDRTVLGALMDWKSAQYPGCINQLSRQWIRDLVQELATCDKSGCRGTLSTLSVGGHLIAAHFGIRTATRLSLWFPAYDVDYRRYSPGLQLFFAIAEAASERHVGILDLSKGEMQYKTSLSSWAYPVASGRVEVNPLSLLARRVGVGARRSVIDLTVEHPHLGAVVPSGFCTSTGCSNPASG